MKRFAQRFVFVIVGALVALGFLHLEALLELPDWSYVPICLVAGVCLGLLTSGIFHD